jgi:hypothetical protein
VRADPVLRSRPFHAHRLGSLHDLLLRWALNRGCEWFPAGNPDR